MARLALLLAFAVLVGVHLVAYRPGRGRGLPAFGLFAEPRQLPPRRRLAQELSLVGAAHAQPAAVTLGPFLAHPSLPLPVPAAHPLIVAARARGPPATTNQLLIPRGLVGGRTHARRRILSPSPPPTPARVGACTQRHGCALTPPGHRPETVASARPETGWNPMSENCLTHDTPHEHGGRCRVWVAAYDEAYRRAGPGNPGGYYEYLPADFKDCQWAAERWPEPHQGVAGTERDDDLLDLSDRAVARRKLMLVTVRALHDALLVGNPAPRVKRMYDRFGRDNAQVGDLVVEVTTLHDHEMRGFGILVEHREEWACTAAEWQKVIDEERRYHEEGGYQDPFDPDGEDYIRQTDHAWYIQYGPKPGDLCRWTNCTFVAIPTSADQLEERVLGEPIEGGGVKLTRDDLVGSLADAGFQLEPGAG